MIHHKQTKTPILYRSDTFTDGPLGERTIMYFYPDGEWDGWRRRKETCEAAYPQSDYEWIDMEEDFDPMLDASLEIHHSKSASALLLETEDA